jgi:hypothetical protein
MSIKHESITVPGTVVYCDGCGKRGHESAYDNIEDTLEMAHMSGWTQNDDERDLCDDCTAEEESKKKPARKRAAR